MQPNISGLPFNGSSVSAPSPVLVNADFSTDQVAPMPSPYNAATGTLTFTQTSGTFGISANRLIANTPASPSWTGQYFSTQGFNRTNGLAVLATWNNAANKGGGPILGWDKSPVGASPFNSDELEGWELSTGSGSISIQDPATSTVIESILRYSLATGTDQQYAVVLHDLGDLWCTRRPGEEAWTIVWVSQPGSSPTSPVYGRFVNFSGAGALSNFQIVAATGLLATPGGIVYAKTLGTLTTGATLPMLYTGWTMVQWTPATGDSLTLNLHQPNSSGTPSDALQLVFPAGSGTTALNAVSGGTATEVGSYSTNFVVGATYTLRVLRQGSQISVWATEPSGLVTVVVQTPLNGSLAGYLLPATDNTGGYSSVTFGASTVENFLTWPIGTTIPGAYGDGSIRRLANYSAKNVDTVLTVPTNPPSNNVPTSTDTTNQVVEPSIFYSPNGWGKDGNGKSWNYWMAISPYPYDEQVYENFSIYVSDDGTTWQVPAGLANVASTTLTSALTSGTAYTSLSVTALTGAIYDGESIIIGSSGQTVVASAYSPPGSTTISVASFTANAAYASGTSVSASLTGNPVVPAPTSADGSNSDQTLFFDPIGGRLWCFDRRALSGTGAYSTIFALSSPDGINWTEEVDPVITGSVFPGDMAPAVVWDGEAQQYVLFTTYGTTTNAATWVLYRRTASSLTGAWSTPIECVLNLANLSPSISIQEVHAHIYQGIYYIIASTSNSGMILLESRDKGISWTSSQEMMNAGLAGNWDSLGCYRGDIVPTATGWDFWQGGFQNDAANGTQISQIGRTTIQVQ